LSRAPASEAYGEEYYAETHRNWFEHPNIKLFETIHRQIFAAKPEASIIDIGCGKGDLLTYLRDRNPRYTLTGIDLSANPPIRGVTMLQGDIRTYSFAQSYDAIVSLAAIEHLDDIHGFVRRLREMCSKDGFVIIMTLNDRSVLYAIARCLASFGWKDPVTRLYDKHHINHFNVESLHRLLTDDGLKVERTLMHNAPLAAMDFPASSKAADMIQRLGVWGAFTIGTAIGATYLQTVVCRLAR
jgi:2-polyprenyl-3-methyl-5-hydroxy-6-metoxy-1,4-benzoquinol methylase